MSTTVAGPCLQIPLILGDGGAGDSLRIKLDDHLESRATPMLLMLGSAVNRMNHLRRDDVQIRDRSKKGLVWLVPVRLLSDRRTESVQYGVRYCTCFGVWGFPLPVRSHRNVLKILLTRSRSATDMSDLSSIKQQPENQIIRRENATCNQRCFSIIFVRSTSHRLSIAFLIDPRL